MRSSVSLARGVATLFAAPAMAADKLTLLLDWYVNPNHGPIIVAQQKGLFEAAGLEVEIVAPSDPSQPPKLVAAGRADIAVDYQSQLYLEHQEGLPLKRIGSLMNSPLSCLLVRADGPIQTLADLKGRTIGYSVPGVDEVSVSIMLASVDLKIEDVTMVNVNWALTQALVSKQADAVTGAYRNVEPHEMAAAGVEGRCFFPEDRGVPPDDDLIFVANLDRASEEDKDKYRRFLGAIELGALYILNHPEESWEAFASYNSDLNDEANKASWAATRGRHSLIPAALDHARYKAFGAWLEANGMIEKAPPVSAIAVDLNAGD